MPLEYMPILMTQTERNQYGFYLTELPIRLFDEYMAAVIHSQSLQRLAERGGLTPAEMLANMRKIGSEDLRDLNNQGLRSNLDMLIIHITLK